MEIIQLEDSFQIANIDKLAVDRVKYKEQEHGSLLPNCVRKGKVSECTFKVQKSECSV